MATIAEKYAELKSVGIAPQGTDPLIIEIPITSTGGTFFNFIGSPGHVIIYFRPDFGAHEVYGAILSSYLTQGGPTGALGFPVSGEYDDFVGQSSVGRLSDFERGTISWFRALNSVTTTLTGPIAISGDFEQVAGIDVSQFQNIIDWSRVATQGTTDGEVVAFAYIRATHDDAGVDTQFSTNWGNSAGRIPRGAYHFFRAKKLADQTRQQLDLFAGCWRSGRASPYG
jgi:Glycosyl hydrolases family 25/LGFP repeat